MVKWVSRSEVRVSLLLFSVTGTGGADLSIVSGSQQPGSTVFAFYFSLAFCPEAR